MDPQPELLPDDVWKDIAPLLETGVVRRTGRPRVSDRRCFAGLLWIAWHRAAWKQLPAKYGSAVTVWRRVRQWRELNALGLALDTYFEAAASHRHPPAWTQNGRAHLTRWLGDSHTEQVANRRPQTDVPKEF